jgi:hypothetical protein
LAHTEHGKERGCDWVEPCFQQSALYCAFLEVNRDKRCVLRNRYSGIPETPTLGITVNCIHPGTTRTERTPSLLAARATQLSVSPEEAERRDFAPDSPRGNAICRMVDASEVAFVAVFLASEKAWAVSGELLSASGGAGRSVYY